MCFLWRSPITRSPEFTSGDFIFNPVIAGSGMLEIGARQLNNWRLHEPPDFLPFCQPGALSTRLYCSWMPRHHFRLPGRYRRHAQVYALAEGDTWMTPYRRYLADGVLPAEPEEGKKVKRNAARYTLVDGVLFRHGFTHAILTCVSGLSIRGGLTS